MAEGIPFASGTGDAAVSTSKPTRLYGWSVTESAGSPAIATAVLRNGTGTGDPIVAIASVPASGKDFQWFGPNGITCTGGLFLDRTGGSTTVVVYVG